MKNHLLFLALSTASISAATLNPVVLVHFDGSVSGTTYTLAPGEFDTTGTFKASATPVLAGGLAALDGGTNVNGTPQDGFDFNPASLGALSSQSWVAETIVSLDTITTGFRTLIDVQGDCDFRVNNAATLLEALYWDGVTDGPVLTSPLPALGTSVHYALVWNAAATSLTAYVNGVAIGSSDHAAFAVPDATNVSFGYFGRSGFDNRGIDGSLDGVAFATFTGTFEPATDFQLHTPTPPLARLYWDINGATPGAGSDGPNGNWGDANWSSGAAGNAATTGWTDGEHAAFSAGSDATGIYDIQLGATPRQAASVLVEEGNLLLAGGTLEIASGGSIDVAAGAFLEIGSTLHAGDLTLSGNLHFGGAATIAGDLAVVSGQLTTDVPLTVGELSGAGAINLGSSDLTTSSTGSSTYSGLLSGSGAVTKQGSGTLTLGSVLNSFSGPLTIASGSLVTGPAAGNGSNGYLGLVDGSRTIRVDPAATLQLTQANVFGGGGKTAATLPAYDIAGGTLRTIRFNTVGQTSLGHGAVLANSSTETDPDYGGFQFLGDITVAGGATPCEILDDGSSRPVHLLGTGTNIFNVADLTSSPDADLVISCDIANGSGDYPGSGSLTKSGPGTLALTGSNSYNGPTTVTAGILAVGGASLADSSSLVIDGGQVSPTGIETVGTLFFGAVQQKSGTWGASGSGAEFTDDRFSGTDGVVIVVTGPPVGYAGWAAEIEGLADPDADLDFEHDGFASGIEWVLGGDPVAPDAAAIAPVLDAGASPGPLLFHFRRSDVAAADAGTTITVEYGSDLTGWIPAQNGVSGVTITPDDNAAAPGIDLVTVSLPRALATDGKFFVRLKVTIAP